MFEWATYFWFIGGVGAGVLHASLLWRAAQQLTAWAPLLGPLRLALVATVLLLAALEGSLLAAAGGWAGGFVAAGLWALERGRAKIREAKSSKS
ncbi:MAG: hypothetical protein KDA45_16630 [Planctomycetales bacterium]|nr:hypothetical protein [Planctomycetales bacterium]